MGKEQVEAGVVPHIVVEVYNPPLFIIEDDVEYLEAWVASNINPWDYREGRGSLVILRPFFGIGHYFWALSFQKARE